MLRFNLFKHADIMKNKQAYDELSAKVICKDYTCYKLPDWPECGAEGYECDELMIPHPQLTPVDTARICTPEVGCKEMPVETICDELFAGDPFKRRCNILLGRRF